MPSTSEMTLTPEAIAAVIEGYTSESGVRQLEKKLAAITRKIVVAKVSGTAWPAVVEPEIYAISSEWRSIHATDMREMITPEW